MKLSKIFALAVGCFIAAQGAMAADLTPEAKKLLEPFPVAQAGHTRQVIFLPALANENDAKVELLIGKEIEVDCNTYFFIGSLEEKTVEGWGYNYWVVDALKGPAGTLMACLDHTRKQAFVTLNNLPLQRYNSRLPIVVFVPEGAQVKYRVWHAGEEVLNAQTR